MIRLSAFLPLVLAACTVPSVAPPAPAPVSDPFIDTLSGHCGKAYAGRLVSSDARDADWAGRRMIAHFADCTPDRIAIALHVEDEAAPGGWNRSRTWLVRRGVSGAVSLHHDHRHADGEPDAVTLYGGTRDPSADPGHGTALAAVFPVDEGSIALFERKGLAASTTNVWRMEVSADQAPDPYLAYQLTRRNDPTRLFRVRFDLSRPVPAPPPAWGWE